MQGALKVVIGDFAVKDVEFVSVYSNVCSVHEEGLTNNSSTNM